jgi:hypothetical protein
MSIDRGDSHYHDAGSWEKACRHIALFLWWAFERGLGSNEVNEIDLVEMAKAPTKTFITRCDTKLYGEDFNEEGQAFAADEYKAYLKAVSKRAHELAVSDYEIPENDETRKWFFDWLDKRLASWRQTR